MKFEDFKKEVPTNSVHSAISSNQFLIDYNIYGDTLEYYIMSYFDCNSSWIRTEDPILLNHEQRHFDIAEVYSRKIKMHLHKLSLEHISDSCLYTIFMMYRQQSINTDSIFDVQTKHGKIKERNKAWDLRINKMLDSLEEYSAPSGKIFLK